MVVSPTTSGRGISTRSRSACARATQAAAWASTMPVSASCAHRPRSWVPTADPVAVALPQLGGQRHHLAESVELGAVGRDEEAARQDQELVVAGQGGDHVGQRDPLALDVDRHLEVEPVGVVGLLRGERELDLRAQVASRKSGRCCSTTSMSGSPRRCGRSWIASDRASPPVATVRPRSSSGTVARMSASTSGSRRPSSGSAEETGHAAER